MGDFMGVSHHLMILSRTDGQMACMIQSNDVNMYGNVRFWRLLAVANIADAQSAGSLAYFSCSGEAVLQAVSVLISPVHSTQHASTFDCCRKMS